MFPHLGILLASWPLTFLLLGQPLLAQPSAVPPAGTPEPVRMATTAFGVTAEIEVRDLGAEAAQEAVEEALSEIFVLSRLTDTDGSEPGGLGVLNRAAGQGPQAIDLRLADLLLRSLQFCIWSNGAFGPLGGELYELWGTLRARHQRPVPSDLRRSVGSTECSRLVLRNDAPDGAALAASATAELTEGSRVDLRGIARGFAVDRAGEVLKESGAQNFWVEVGNVWSARGGGPDGRGWLATLPPVPGEEEPLDRIWLRDQSVAMLSIEPIRGETHEPLIDQRSGVPARGVISVVAVTTLAVDAEPLVSSLFVLGHREGHMRLGSLNPRPSVYWLLGQDDATAMASTYHWSELERVWRR